MCISIGCAIGFTIEEIHIKRETSARCALIIAVVLRLPLWKHQMESRSEINNTVWPLTGCSSSLASDHFGIACQIHLPPNVAMATTWVGWDKSRRQVLVALSSINEMPSWNGHTVYLSNARCPSSYERALRDLFSRLLLFCFLILCSRKPIASQHFLFILCSLWRSRKLLRKREKNQMSRSSIEREAHTKCTAPMRPFVLVLNFILECIIDRMGWIETERWAPVAYGRSQNGHRTKTRILFMRMWWGDVDEKLSPNSIISRIDRTRVSHVWRPSRDQCEREQMNAWNYLEIRFQNRWQLGNATTFRLVRSAATRIIDILIADVRARA